MLLYVNTCCYMSVLGGSYTSPPEAEDPDRLPLFGIMALKAAINPPPLSGLLLSPHVLPKSLLKVLFRPAGTLAIPCCCAGVTGIEGLKAPVSAIVPLYSVL